MSFAQRGKPQQSPRSTPVPSRASRLQIGNIFPDEAERKASPQGTSAPAPAPAPAAQQAAAKAAPAKPAPAREGDIANALLNLEREARRAETEAELGYLIVNGSRVALPYRQALLIMRAGPSKHHVAAVSSLSAIDRNSTFIRWVERMVRERVTKENLGKIVAVDAAQGESAADPDAKGYPFKQIVLVPLSLRDGTVFAHLMLSREIPWDEKSMVAAARLCETYAHAWELLAGPKRTKRKLKSRTMLYGGLAATLLLAGFLPVPLTALAPAEVTPRDAWVVAAPLDGAIEQIMVEPNSAVSKGDVLLRYKDTELRNRLELAGQAVRVAEARYQQNLRTSFADPVAKRELAIAQSELNLKSGEYDYARALLDRAVVVAERDGIATFEDRDTWTGRPVAVGERIMRIADPAKVQVTVKLPIADAIVLNEGAPVSLYLDSDPLKAVEASLVSASFHATPDSAGNLAYTVRAHLADGEIRPRIGLHGTAKVHGEQVSLAYYLFRKPWAAVRQWTGL